MAVNDANRTNMLAGSSSSGANPLAQDSQQGQSVASYAAQASPEVIASLKQRVLDLMNKCGSPGPIFSELACLDDRTTFATSAVTICTGNKVGAPVFLGKLSQPLLLAVCQLFQEDKLWLKLVAEPAATIAGLCFKYSIPVLTNTGELRQDKPHWMLLQLLAKPEKHVGKLRLGWCQDRLVSCIIDWQH